MKKVYVNIVQNDEFVKAREKAQVLVGYRMFKDVYTSLSFRQKVENIEKVLGDAAYDIICETADAVYKLCHEKQYAAAYIKYLEINSSLSEKINNEEFKVEYRQLIAIIAICDKLTNVMSECDEFALCDILSSVQTIVSVPSCIQYINC